MAVSSEVARVVHTANGTATFFSYSPIDGATSANLKVYLFNPTTGVLTLQTIGTDYTFGGGGVTFTTAPPAGRRVILYRVVPLLQPDNYKTNAPFPAVVTEKRFDEVVRGVQQINDIVQNRAIILPLGDAGFSANTLPAVENRKGRVLYFNATTGDPEAQLLANTVVTVPAWAQSFLSQATAAAGLANIGAVAKAGDTMTGFLTLHADPTAAMHAATKSYVDTGVGARVAKAGDTMTGFLTLHADPTAATHAATKQYVDAGVGARVAKAGDTMTGPLTLPGPPTAANHAATKNYVDSLISAGPYVLKAGDTMTGALTLPGAPTAANHAATKAYVDGEVGTRVAKAGDTMTGFLTLHADPTAAMHAVTRRFAVRQGGRGELLGPIATTTGSAYDVTNIPSWARRAEIWFDLLSVSAAASIFVRVGTGGNPATTGYAGGHISVQYTTGFWAAGHSGGAGHNTGRFLLTQSMANTNRWIFTGIVYRNAAGTTILPAGSITLSGPLDIIRIFTDAGSFNGGSFYIYWQE